MLSWGGGPVMRLPQCGPGTGRHPGPLPSSFPQVTGSDYAAGWHCRLPFAGEMSARQALGRVSLDW